MAARQDVEEAVVMQTVPTIPKAVVAPHVTRHVRRIVKIVLITPEVEDVLVPHAAQAVGQVVIRDVLRIVKAIVVTAVHPIVEKVVPQPAKRDVDVNVTGLVAVLAISNVRLAV